MKKFSFEYDGNLIPGLIIRSTSFPGLNYIHVGDEVIIKYYLGFYILTWDWVEMVNNLVIKKQI